MKKTPPITIQQWINQVPDGTSSSRKKMTHQESLDSLKSFDRKSLGYFTRGDSMQSDDNTSQCSSVESVLESRRPDPETVLLELGFGPPRSTDFISKIPKRFLQPSKVRGIDIGQFLKEKSEFDHHMQLRKVPQSFNVQVNDSSNK